MSGNVDPKTYEGGEFLKGLKFRFLNDRSEENMFGVFTCLRDSILIVPATAKFSDADAEILSNVKEEGDVVTTKDDIRLKPDILKKDDKNYFPIFSNADEMPDWYASKVSTIEMTMPQVVEMAKNWGGLDGIVLDGFTMPMVIPFGIADIILKTPSVLKKD